MDLKKIKNQIEKDINGGKIKSLLEINLIITIFCDIATNKKAVTLCEEVKNYFQKLGFKTSKYNQVNFLITF